MGRAQKQNTVTPPPPSLSYFCCVVLSCFSCLSLNKEDGTLPLNCSLFNYLSQILNAFCFNESKLFSFIIQVWQSLPKGKIVWEKNAIHAKVLATQSLHLVLKEPSNFANFFNKKFFLFQIWFFSMHFDKMAHALSLSLSLSLYFNLSFVLCISKEGTSKPVGK